MTGTSSVIASPSLRVILSRSPEQSEGTAKNLMALRTGSAKHPPLPFLEIASSLTLLTMTGKGDNDEARKFAITGKGDNDRERGFGTSCLAMTR